MQRLQRKEKKEKLAGLPLGGKALCYIATRPDASCTRPTAQTSLGSLGARRRRKLREGRRRTPKHILRVLLQATGDTRGLVWSDTKTLLSHKLH